MLPSRILGLHEAIIHIWGLWSGDCPWNRRMEQHEDVKFRQMLLEVQGSLRDDDLNDLMFLCSDHLTLRDLSTVSTATDLFTHLENQQKLTPDDPSLLLELLAIIKQHSLIRKLGLDDCMENSGATYRFISLYR